MGRKAELSSSLLVDKQERSFAHALVVGVERPPRKVTKSMTKTKFDRKSRMKPFVKFVNYKHMMPTRFVLKDDLEFKNVVTEEKMAGGAEASKLMKKELKKQLQTRYLAPEPASEKQAAVDFL